MASSSSSTRRFLGDFCVLGASGFYGAQAVVALADLAARYVAKPTRKVAAAAAGDGADSGGVGAAAADSAAAIVIVLAGRNPFKLAAMLPTLQQQADAASTPRRVRLEVLPVPVDVAGDGGQGGDGGSNLRALALAAPVLLNCIRPVEYEWSERVMAACAEASTAYLDLCARPAFLSAVREMFAADGGGAAAPPPSSSSSSSSPAPAPLVPGCGFDYALPDVGTWHALQAYRARNGGRMPTRVRTTFLVHTPRSAGGGSGGGGGFRLRLGAVDELLAPPAGTPGAGHRGWDPRRDDVRAALERAAARRRALEARGLATPSGGGEAEGETAGGRRWPPLLLLPRREPSDLHAGPRWTLPFFVGGAVEADLLRANLTEGVEEDGSSGSAPAPPPLQFDCRVALPALPSARALLLLLFFWPLLLSLACPLLATLALGAALARRSPPGGLARSLYLAALPYLTLGLVTADDGLARRSADASRFERVCVLSEGGEGGEEGARSLRVSFRGSFAQSLTPQCIAAAAVCLLNQRQHEVQTGAAETRAGPPAGAAAEAAAATRPPRRPRVLTPAQALARPPPPGCPSFLDMLCARHGLVIEEEVL
jgi:hypothetical protein